MDAFIEEINSDATYGITVFYSTPSEYIDAVNAMQYRWPVNRDDFFIDTQPSCGGCDAHAYLSEYFSSRPV